MHTINIDTKSANLERFFAYLNMVEDGPGQNNERVNTTMYIILFTVYDTVLQSSLLTPSGRMSSTPAHWKSSQSINQSINLFVQMQNKYLTDTKGGCNLR